MSEDLGVISYEVRADLSDAISSTSEFDKALKSTESATKKTDSAIAGLNTTTTKVADGVRKATTQMSGMKGVAQGLGYQIQDVAVQLQSGTSAMVVFGQQGSQIASMFGPGGAVIGAIIAIAAAIGGTLVKSLKGANIEFDAMKDKVMDLTKSQRELAKLELSGKIEETTEKLKEYNKEYTSGMVAGNVFYSGEKGAIQYKAAQESLNKELSSYKNRINELSGSGAGLTSEFVGTREALEIQTLAMEKGERAAALYAARLSIVAKAKETGANEKAVEDELRNQNALINKYYDLKDAEDRANKAKQEAAKSASKTASELKREETAHQSNTQKIEEAKEKTQQLSEQYANLKFNQDGTIDSTVRHTQKSAELAAQQQLNKQATEDQVSALAKEILAQDQLKQKYDAQIKAAQERNRLSKEFNPVGQVGVDYAKQQKDLETARAMNLVTEQGYTEQKAILARQYEADRLAAAEAYFSAQSLGNEFMMNSLNALSSAATSTISGMLSGTMSVTEAMQNFASIILNQAVGALVEMGINQIKNQILSDALARTQQANIVATNTTAMGASTANAAVQTANATEVAAASAPAAAATATWSWGTAALVGGAALLGTYALAKAAGGRRYGGPVNPGSAYRVNEGGAPEIFQSGSSQYMIPNSRGEVVSNSDATNSGSGVTINVNNSIADTASVSTSYDEASKTVTLAINAVAQQLASRTGPVSKGLAAGWNVNGRTA